MECIQKQALRCAFYPFFQGPMDDPDSFITNVCGYREYLMFQTTGPELNLEFTTDGQKTGKGFRITFETGKNYELIFPQPDPQSQF